MAVNCAKIRYQSITLPRQEIKSKNLLRLEPTAAEALRSSEVCVAEWYGGGR
jgi:hypothetical protein